VASLLYQLEEASNLRDVSFNSIASGGADASSTATAAAAPAAGSTTSSASSGFTQMPFTFVFSGGFFSLEHLFRELTSFTTHQGPDGLRVSGRLLTIQSVKLSPETTSTATSHGGGQKLTGTVTATAYVLPAGSDVTAGATPSAPAGVAAPSSSSSSPTTPAVAKVTP
jgi:hypothetical protein